MDDRTINRTADLLEHVPGQGGIETMLRIHPEYVQNDIHDFGILIDRFNSFHLGSDEVALMPAVQDLLRIVGDGGLPTLQEMTQDGSWNREFTNGVRETTEKLRAGILQADDPSLVSEENIRAGTLPTNDRAKLTGFIGHAFERIIFQRLRETTHVVYHKDDILVALEQVLLFMHFNKENPPLFNQFTSAPARNEQGGLGWVTPNTFNTFREQFEAYRAKEKATAA